jgi:hypothetical protein
MSRRQETAGSAHKGSGGAQRDDEELAALIEELCAEAVSGISHNKIEEGARPWLAKADLDLDNPKHMARFMEALVFSGYLAVFTPSLTGAAPIVRFIRDRRSGADSDTALALDALARADFRLLRIDSVCAPDRCRATDLANGEEVTLREEIPEEAVGCDVALWLTTTPKGEIVALGVIAPLDGAALAEVMKFVRPGQGLRNPHRCAAALYRHVVRHDTLRIEGLNVFSEEMSDFPDEDEEEWDELQKLAVAVTAQEIAEACGESITGEILQAARAMTNVVNLTEALSRSVVYRAGGKGNFAEAFSWIGFVMLETLDRRHASGFGGATQSIEAIAGVIERAIAEGEAPEGVAPLFQELRVKLMATQRGKTKGRPQDDELARVLQRIQALRAKTVAQGCTEQEALASAQKVAELLDRYGLSLDEIEMRERPCEGIGVDTGRKRTSPIDDCAPAIADFYDCRMWFEKTASGSLRFVFFGLPEDVAAAHYLYDLIVVAFKTETDAFKKRSKADISGRNSSRSFQIGFGHGICLKLNALKAERDKATRKADGRALAVVKSSVVEDEMEKLGLSFLAKERNRSRKVLVDDYRAGVAAGEKFEPHLGVEAE